MNPMEIRILCQELKLHGIRESFEARRLSAQHEGQDPGDFLARLLEDEKRHRKNLRGQRLEHQAQFRRQAHLDQWDDSFDRGVPKSKLKELAGLSFWHEKANLILTGGTGSGKTELSIILGKLACQAQLTVKFMSVNEFFEEAYSQRAAGKYRAWFTRQKEFDIVVFDDFALRSYQHDECLMLLDFLEDRYRTKVHIFSSQVELEGWPSLIEDPVLAEALMDRIKNPSKKVKITGPSYREKLGAGQR